MTALNAAAAQAELMEKEKHIVELQGRVQQLKSGLQNMSNHQVALEREKRRSAITLGELGTLDDSHHVFKGVGRMFVAATVPQLRAEYKDREVKCSSEVARLSEEKTKIAAAIKKEDEQLQAAVGEFVNAVRLLQATQQLPQQQQ
jgi:chaperonin cofactor prefoldin